MAEFSDEEYLRVLADNGDREAVKEYEQALDNRIFQLQISLAQTSDPQGRSCLLYTSNDLDVLMSLSIMLVSVNSSLMIITLAKRYVICLISIPLQR